MNEKEWPPIHENLKFIGTATSHFQSEPVMWDHHIRLPATSDWEHELEHNIRGKKSCIRTVQDEQYFPRFLANKDRYIRTSGELGQNMFRLSIDPARLCPAFCEYNRELMAEYVRALALIRLSGQEPMLTLHHYTMPLSLCGCDDSYAITSGAWEHRSILDYFWQYIDFVCDCLEDSTFVRSALQELKLERALQDRLIEEGLVRYVLTINEPIMTWLHCYVTGHWPPFKRCRFTQAKRILQKMVDAHDIMADRFWNMKRTLHGRKAQVGIGYNWQKQTGLVGGFIHDSIDEWHTKLFERDGSRSDFIGLHYYFRGTLRPGFMKKGPDYSDHPGFGMIDPAGIGDVLKQMHALYPQKDIFVAEIGFADEADIRRPFWILETVRHIFKAAQSMPIRGILLWSLVDNLEWDLGMSQQFGLFAEHELTQPHAMLSDRVRSYQAWQAVARDVHQRDLHSREWLVNLYDSAKQQYLEYSG